MTTAEYIATWLPVAVIALGVFATYVGPLGVYLSARTHNEKLQRITNAAGRIAATIAKTLAALPAGANSAAIQQVLVGAAVQQLRGKFAESAAAIGASDVDLHSIVTGELDKLPAHVKALPVADALINALKDPPPATGSSVTVVAKESGTPTPAPLVAINQGTAA